MSDEIYPFETGDHLSAAALNAALAMGQSNQWRSGPGGPVDATGKNGDMYLNTTTGDIYQRVSGVYVLQANIKGPPGPPGSTTPGPPGPPGAAGGGVSSIATTGGISGGPITTAGTLQVNWNGPLVNAIGSNLTAAGGTLQVVGAPPPAASTITGTLTYAQLPTEVQQLPIVFGFAGKPATGAIANVPMAFAVTVPAGGLTGTVAYDSTKATANAGFVVNKISGGSITPIGTVTVTPASNTSITLAGGGGSMAAGDVLQMVAPTADATLSDCSITILASRV